MADNRIPPKKSLGQHFLHEASILDKIIRFSGDLTQTNVIEIGPGPGALTKALLAAGAKQVVAVETDTRFIAPLQALSERYDHRLTVTHADAMRLDVTTLAPAPRAVISNLPYNVGTLLLIGWLEQIATQGPDTFTAFTLMFQKEVAERIAAPPGGRDYGKISVLAQWLCEVEYGFDVAPGCFTPPPKIRSGVIKLTTRPAPAYPATWEGLTRMLAAAFGQRRKMLRSALKSLVPNPEIFLKEAGIDPTRRAETLSVEEFCRLTTAYKALE